MRVGRIGHRGPGRRKRRRPEFSSDKVLEVLGDSLGVWLGGSEGDEVGLDVVGQGASEDVEDLRHLLVCDGEEQVD